MSRCHFLLIAGVKNYFMMIKEIIYKRVLIEGKILTLNYP